MTTAAARTPRPRPGPGEQVPAPPMEAVARAETALRQLADQFAGWLEEEVARLEAARTAADPADADHDGLQELHLRAHDLKGLGGVYGFPLVTRVAAGLCRLLHDEAARRDAPPALVDAHVAAVRALVRDGVRDPAHAGGVELCEALEGRVAAHLGDATGSVHGR